MKKTIYVLLVILAILVISSTVVFATISNNGQQSILTGEKLANVGDTYEEIEEVATFSLNNTQKRVISKANEYVENLNVKDVIFSEENSNVKNYNNALESRVETVVSNNDAIIKINAETNELISYINTDTQFERNTLTREEIQTKAISIFNNLENTNKEEYELIYIEQFDDEIWRAGFAKKYSGLINENESIKFSFCPQTGEIVTLNINKVSFDNNETLITEEDARNIAKPYLDKSVADNMDISVEIVRPNYFYTNALANDEIYVNIAKTRKAYVCTFNNDAESKVYVDCTTGEVIGGNMILGGEY